MSACARAIAVGGPSSRTIKGMPIAGTETDPDPETNGDAGAVRSWDSPGGSPRSSRVGSVPHATEAHETSWVPRPFPLDHLANQMKMAARWSPAR